MYAQPQQYKIQIVLKAFSQTLIRQLFTPNTSVDSRERHKRSEGLLSRVAIMGYKRNTIKVYLEYSIIDAMKWVNHWQYRKVEKTSFVYPHPNQPRE